MKKHLFLFCFSLLSTSLFSQVNLEQTFDFSASITRINANEYKYFLMDVGSEQCRVYNTDFSLFKTINLDIPDGEWLYDIKFVSEDLFNDDGSIELLYTYYKWITTNASTGDGYYVYHTKIKSESGSVLIDQPGALYSFIKEVGTDTYSLFLYIYDFSKDPYTIKTVIYSLPGKFNAVDEAKKAGFAISAYPNPASNFIQLEYTLPAGIKNAKLYLRDIKGNVHQVFHVDGFMDHLKINTEGIIPGIYFYSLDARGYKSEAKKVIIK